MAFPGQGWLEGHVLTPGTSSLRRHREVRAPHSAPHPRDQPGRALLHLPRKGSPADPPEGGRCLSHLPLGLNLPVVARGSQAEDGSVGSENVGLAVLSALQPGSSASEREGSSTGPDSWGAGEATAAFVVLSLQLHGTKRCPAVTQSPEARGCQRSLLPPPALVHSPTPNSPVRHGHKFNTEHEPGLCQPRGT